MKDIKKFIKESTGLTVKVLSHNYYSTTDLHCVKCFYNSHMCFFAISPDRTYINIYADDYNTLQKISRILDDKKNKKSFIYTNNLYNFNSLTQYPNFLYRLEVVTHEEYYKELQKEIKERIKAR